MGRRKRWPDCKAVKMVRGLAFLDETYDRTLTCTKPVLHLGKHVDAWAQLSWRQENRWEALA